MGGQLRQNLRDGFGIPGGEKEAEDATGGDRGEEICEIDLQNDLATGVRTEELLDRPTGTKAVARFMDRHVVKQGIQEAALRSLEERLGRLQKTPTALPLRNPPMMIMILAAIARKPEQLTQLQP
jgi:hypothetical protein